MRENRGDLKRLFVGGIICFFASSVWAQTNLQLFYDMGGDRKFITSTLEMFKGDRWGNSYFFVDFNYNNQSARGNVVGPDMAYWEISRGLNFWKNTYLAPLSLQVEYNGGLGIGYCINNAWLGGVDYYLHNANHSMRLNMKLLYKYIDKKKSNVPMQLTTVWGCDNLFGVKGLMFSGFADFWWETTQWGMESSHNVFLSEPQLWYGVGALFDCPNLWVGGEVEIANNFTGNIEKGWQVNPCLGVKWDF